MIRRPPRSTLDRSSAASDVYKRQTQGHPHRHLSLPACCSRQEKVGHVRAGDQQNHHHGEGQDAQGVAIEATETGNASSGGSDLSTGPFDFLPVLLFVFPHPGTCLLREPNLSLIHI